MVSSELKQRLCFTAYAGQEACQPCNIHQLCCSVTQRPTMQTCVRDPFKSSQQVKASTLQSANNCPYKLPEQNNECDTHRHANTAPHTQSVSLFPFGVAAVAHQACQELQRLTERASQQPRLLRAPLQPAAGNNTVCI